MSGEPQQPTQPSRRGALRRRARDGRGRRAWPWVLGALLVAAGAGYLVLGRGSLDRSTVERLLPRALRGELGREFTLYFADPRWSRLVPERRRLGGATDAVSAMHSLVQALAEGPRGDGAPVLPKGAKLKGAYLGEDGVAVLDFDPELTTFEPGGASGEVLTVFALVHTLAENVPGVRAVQILVGGEERDTLAGHVKISEPLGADPQWTSGAN